MRTRFKDIRNCRRVLLQSFVVTVVAALVAALGFGANTNPGAICPANHSNWRSRNQVFGDIAAARDVARMHLTGSGAPEDLLAGEVTANFFQMIGVKPVFGRSFSTEQDRRGNGHVAILSHRLWRRRFSSDRGMIGRSIMLNGESYQVIGILPRDFSWNNRRTDVWVPYRLDPNRGQRMAVARPRGV
jgi:putative ABC transport system permease protein